MDEEEKNLKILLEKPEWTAEEKRWLLHYLESSEGTELMQLMQGHFERVQNASELIQRLHNDDTMAFDTVYNLYHAAVYNNVMKLTGNKATTEKIVGEVFISLWDMRHSLRSEQALSGWVFTVGYHKSITYLKDTLKKKLGK